MTNHQGLQTPRVCKHIKGNWLQDTGVSLRAGALAITNVTPAYFCRKIEKK